jgi:uncharacterized protein YegL
MRGAPIDSLNQGLQIFQADLSKDNLAQRRVEIAIVTFGDAGVRTLQNFVTSDSFEAPILFANGNTPMGEAIIHGLDLLRERKALYKSNGVQYYRPWVFLITDGAPTDRWEAAAQRVHDDEKAGALAFFAVGVGAADMEKLAQIAVRRPVKLDGLKFAQMFLWLSSSQKRVSASRVGERTSLPPLDDWSEV